MEFVSCVQHGFDVNVVNRLKILALPRYMIRRRGSARPDGRTTSGWCCHALRGAFVPQTIVLSVHRILVDPASVPALQ